MDTERLRMRLNIMKMKDFKAAIVLKSKRLEPFIAKVSEFLYDEDDTKVVFMRTPETVFPTDKEDSEENTYTSYIKNIKSVVRYEAPNSK